MTRAILCAGLLALSSGCYSVNAQLPGTLRGDVRDDDTQVVGHVRIEKTHWFFLAGLIGGPAEDLFAEELRQQVKAAHADGAANLVYDAQSSCFDVFITSVSCNVCTPRSYALEGSLVRIKRPPLGAGTASTEPVLPAPPPLVPTAPPAPDTAY